MNLRVRKKWGGGKKKSDIFTHIDVLRIMKSEGNHQGQGKEYTGGTFTSRGMGQPILKAAGGMDAGGL